MSFTGIFAKSSNVGTLLAAQEVGQERYAEMLQKFGLGKRTDSGVPGEESGHGPAAQPVVRLDLRQPADRPGPLDDAAADDRDVPDHRQRRRPHPAAPHPRRDRPRTARARRSRGPTAFAVVSPGDRRRPCATCSARSRSRIRATRTRTAPARRPPCPATRSRARPAPRSRSTRPASATRRASTGSRSPASCPPTTRATSSASCWTRRTARAQRSAAPLFHDIATYLTQRFQVPMSAEQTPFVRAAAVDHFSGRAFLVVRAYFASDLSHAQA